MNTVWQKTIFVCMALVTFPGALFGQRGLFLTGGLEFGGSGKHYNFQQEGNKLAKDWLLYPDTDLAEFTINPEITIHYHFWNHFGLSLNLKLMEKMISVHDQSFMTAHRIPGTLPYEAYVGGSRTDRGNFNISKLYFNPSLSGYYLFRPPCRSARPFVSFGVGFNRYISGNRNVSCSYYHAGSDENLVLNAQYRKSFFSQTIEAGYFFSGRRRNRQQNGKKLTTRVGVGSIALRYSFIGHFMSAEYQNNRNTIEQYRDRMTASGSYFSVVFKIGGGFLADAMDKNYKEKRRKTAVKMSETEKPAHETPIPGKINGRRMVTRKDIMVRSTSVLILIADHARYDKDIVSLNLNGEWILKDYILNLDRLTIHADLQDGLNYLVAYAVSEGSEKPCTVSVIIDDGITQQEVILNSNMKQSESIRIRVSP